MGPILKDALEILATGRRFDLVRPSIVSKSVQFHFLEGEKIERKYACTSEEYRKWWDEAKLQLTRLADAFEDLRE